MSFWMELHCDAGHAGCVTGHEDNRRPSGEFRNAIAGVKILSEVGEQQGWTFVKGLGHICPRCKVLRDASAA